VILYRNQQVWLNKENLNLIQCIRNQFRPMHCWEHLCWCHMTPSSSALWGQWGCFNIVGAFLYDPIIQCSVRTMRLF
jgi:hypothetical protein